MVLYRESVEDYDSGLLGGGTNRGPRWQMGLYYEAYGVLNTGHFSELGCLYVLYHCTSYYL